jgi:hypothetical protein
MKCASLLVQKGPSWVSSLPVFKFGINQLTQTGGTHNIDIAKLVKPKVVHGVGRRHEVAFAQLLVGFCGGDIELV